MHYSNSQTTQDEEKAKCPMDEYEIKQRYVRQLIQIHR